jgi:hypothetical protein
MAPAFGESIHEIPRSLKQAIALRTLSLLLRRHHVAHSLRLFEMHPGGGMYDCLGLILGSCEGSLCLFNLAGTSLSLHQVGPKQPPEGRPREWHDDLWRYPGAYFAAGSAEEFVEVLEARLGLGPVKKAPPATPATVSVAVLAELANRYALSRRAPAFRSGWEDTSGMGGSGVRAWVADFPTIQARCDAAPREDWTARALAANRLWGVQGREETRPKVVIDVAKGRVFLDAKPVGSVWDRYRKGAGFRDLAWWVEGLWLG